MALIETFKGQSSAPAMRLMVGAEAFQGLADVRGMLLFDGTSLRFEFQTADALFGVLRSEPKQLEVPLTSIDGVRVGRGWFWLRPYLELELNDFALLSRVPGQEGGRWRLQVRWRDRQALRRLASALSFARSSALHQRLNVGLDHEPERPVVVEPPPQPLREVQGTPPRQPEG